MTATCVAYAKRIVAVSYFELVSLLLVTPSLPHLILLGFYEIK